MRAKKKFYVVAYDLKSDRNRNKVSKILEKYGVRANFSVFECMFTAKQLEQVKERIARLIDKRTDRVIYYPLCLNCHTGIYRQPPRETLITIVEIV